MAVYTTVTDDALAAFLKNYELGAPLTFKGIAEGVENSNYFLETETGRFILTLFEKRTNPQELPYFVALKQHLAAHGFPCPEPVMNRDGVALGTLAGRPALIVTFLSGLSLKRPKPPHCRELGRGLANLHAKSEEFPLTRKNALGASSWPELWKGRQTSAEALAAGLAGDIEADLKATEALTGVADQLPTGTIHADLFPDNAFFLGDRFCGAIDFYFACTDALLYDLAVCLNAWAFEPDGEYNFSSGANLIAGYQSIRELTRAEVEALPLLARGAALRFFLTRLIDWTDTPGDALVKPKDPLEYARRLTFHRHAAAASEYGYTVLS